MRRAALLRRFPLPLLLVVPLALLAGCEADPPAGALPAPVLQPVEVPAGTGAGMPFVASAGDGFALSWIEPASPSPGEASDASADPDPETHLVRMARMEADGSWRDPVTLASGSDFFVNWADFPSVAHDGTGQMAAHWLQMSGEGTYDYDIVVATSTDDGRTWSEPVLLHTDGVQAEHGFVSLVPDGEGFDAVWLDGREMPGGGPMTLRAGRLAADGTPTDEIVVDPRICECCQTGAARTDEGVVAVYRGRSEDEVRDIGVVRMDGNRAWSEPAVLHADGWELRACPVNGPAVSAEGSHVVAAWFTGAGDEPRVRVAFSSDAGASWSDPVEVDEGQPLGRVDVEILPGGTGALVVWLEAGDEDAAILARQVDASGQMGAAGVLAGTEQARASGFPRMARGGDRILLAWTEPGGGRGAPSRLAAGWLDWQR
ncbi:MAG: exo-alpha-sialidase [Gemmatimonadales bacterium]|nr:MAG: exo-alpha-sialidase [Gemmatimonadales bacterium]